MLAENLSYIAIAYYGVDTVTFFAFSSPRIALDDNLPSKPLMIGEAAMLIKKADVEKYFAAKRRRYNTPLAIQSAVGANSFRPFGSSIKTPPAPAEAAVPVSTSKST